MVQGQLRVSIVIPVYNVSLYIERCVKSVMDQTYAVLECIIVDDASLDDSIAKCERLIEGYDGPIRFVVLHHDYNRGLSAARNTGTDAAQGDFIFYLDSDDELTPDCIEKLAEPMEDDSSIEMVQGNYRVFSGASSAGRISREEEFASSEAVRDFYFDKNALPVNAWNKLISKKFLTSHGLCFMEGLLYEDNPWTFNVLKYLHHLYVIPDITYNHYKRPLSITTGTDKTEEAYHYSIVYEDIAENFTPGEEAREAKYYLGPYYSFFMKYPKMEGFRNALPFFEDALVGDGYQKERLRLWVLRLSSKSAVLYWFFVVLLKVRLALLYPFRRLAVLWKMVKK